MAQDPLDCASAWIGSAFERVVDPATLGRRCAIGVVNVRFLPGYMPGIDMSDVTWCSASLHLLIHLPRTGRLALIMHPRPQRTHEVGVWGCPNPRVLGGRSGALETSQNGATACGRSTFPKDRARPRRSICFHLDARDTSLRPGLRAAGEGGVLVSGGAWRRAVAWRPPAASGSPTITTLTAKSQKPCLRHLPRAARPPNPRGPQRPSCPLFHDVSTLRTKPPKFRRAHHQPRPGRQQQDRAWSQEPPPNPDLLPRSDHVSIRKRLCSDGDL